MSTRERPVYVGSFEPGSEEWHAARRTGLGGSEIAAVLGLSPWESRFSLWHRKQGLAAPVVVNEQMYWGTRLEPVIRAEWNKRHADDGLAVREVGTWAHYQHPWMVANPDGANDTVLWEGKTAYTADGWGEPGTDEIPIYYRTQCLWYLDVFGFDTCHVSALISGSDYREYRVEYSAEEAAFMRDKARDFLDSLDTNQRPNIDEHSATYQTVRELNPDIEDVRIDVPGHIAVPFLDAQQACKDAEDARKRAAAALADHMGSARRAYYEGRQIAMRISKGGGVPFVQATATKTIKTKVTAA